MEPQDGRRGKRSTRGQKPELTADQLAADHQFYSSLFGEAAFEEEDQPDPEERRKQELKEARQKNLKDNLSEYPYVRSFHYFYDLRLIDRLEGHPSYAVDKGELFTWNYSQDDKLIGSQRIGDLINRKYFGLPVECGKQINEGDHNHWDQFYEKEEKKYANDRMLYTCLKIKKNLANLINTGKIRLFKNIVKRDPDFEFLSKRRAIIQDKEVFIDKKINELLKKKELNRFKEEDQDQKKLMVTSFHANDKTAVAAQQSEILIEPISEEAINTAKKVKQN